MAAVTPITRRQTSDQRNCSATDCLEFGEKTATLFLSRTLLHALFQLFADTFNVTKYKTSCTLFCSRVSIVEKLRTHWFLLTTRV